MTVHSHSTGGGEPRVAEGPDIMLIARALATKWCGCSIISVSPGPRCPSVRNLSSVILPSTLRSIGCHGSMVWFDIDERILTVSVGQHTRVMANDGADPRYVALAIAVSDGTFIYFVDHRRYVNARIVEPSDVRRYVNVTGPNVTDLGRADVKRVSDAAITVERTVSEALADDAVLTGVGQRLASEALYAARISPWRPAHAVTQHEWGKVLNALHVESMRALSIGLAASVHEHVPSLSWSIPAIVYGRTRLDDGTQLVSERCTASWMLTWAPGVQT